MSIETQEIELETALAELSGIRMCEAPGCFRQLKTVEGVVTQIGDRWLHTCFGPCLSYAREIQNIHYLEIS